MPGERDVTTMLPNARDMNRRSFEWVEKASRNLQALASQSKRKVKSAAGKALPGHPEEYECIIDKHCWTIALTLE